MPNYLSPGVYVEEVEAGSRPIEGVGTAVAAFVGLAERGPANTPTLVTNWSQFSQTFGGFMEGSYLAHSVYGYFLNGGGAAYVVRVGANGHAPTAQAELPSAKDKALSGYRVLAIEAGQAGNDITVEVAEASQPADDTFKLVISKGGKVEETYDNVTARKGRNNVVTAVKASKLIQLEEIGTTGALEKVPAPGKLTLVGGGSTAPARVTPDEYVGNSADRTGFAGLEAIDNVTMLAVPDLMAAYQKGMIDADQVKAVQLAMIAHCELMGDRVAILDAPPGLNAQQIREWRVDKAGYDSKYATLYWPWVKVFDPLAGVLRAFPGRGIRVWGARTLSSDPAWRYINVRRLFNYIEGSVLGGTQWVVFEPNDMALWERVKRTISAFLVRVWRDGALFGATPAEAFYVKCDGETNTAESIDAGQLIVEIGIAPVKPAEFVIFRIAQFSGGASLSE